MIVCFNDSNDDLLYCSVVFCTVLNLSPQDWSFMSLFCDTSKKNCRLRSSLFFTLSLYHSLLLLLFHAVTLPLYALFLSYPLTLSLSFAFLLTCSSSLSFSPSVFSKRILNTCTQAVLQNLLAE